MTKKKYSVDELKKIAQDIRIQVIQMLSKAKSGHPGGSLSMVDILVALFFDVMTFDPHNKTGNDRDRFHLSKGHGCPTLYAILARLDFFPQAECDRLRQLGGLLQGHPHPKTPGIEVASGSLGQGLSIACGMALAQRLDRKKGCVFTVLGDGELQEGQVWEAALFAAHRKLDNLIVIIDCNGMQIDGKIEDIINLGPLEKKWEAFGFTVHECDGHNITTLIETMTKARTAEGKPHVIIAKTVKGKGVSFMEGNLDFHGKSPTTEETEQALGELKKQS
ncbi:MAG: transketolase [Candidatus Omnitrophica bacterium]|nr:transketolase [Candidatus Omnitrophota bacterium]